MKAEIIPNKEWSQLVTHVRDARDYVWLKVTSHQPCGGELQIAFASKSNAIASNLYKRNIDAVIQPTYDNLWIVKLTLPQRKTKLQS